MKNVAATSGQSVNFAALFFEMGSAWEGIWAGRDKVLNFFSRPPKVTLAFQFLEASSPFEEYNLCPRMQEKNGAQRNFFRTSQRNFGTRRFVPDAAVALAGTLYFTTGLRSRPSRCDTLREAFSFQFLPESSA
jgi:hypothetical protein